MYLLCTLVLYTLKYKTESWAIKNWITKYFELVFFKFKIISDYFEVLLIRSGQMTID